MTDPAERIENFRRWAGTPAGDPGPIAVPFVIGCDHEPTGSIDPAAWAEGIARLRAAKAAKGGPL